MQIPGSEVIHKQARDGGTLQLTIDSDLQWFVQRIAEAQVQAVGADWATVTVMEAKTGRLLAVADVPTVDPNDPAGDAGGRTAGRARSPRRSSRARRSRRSPRHPSSTPARPTR